MHPMTVRSRVGRATRWVPAVLALCAFPVALMAQSPDPVDRAGRLLDDGKLEEAAAILEPLLAGHPRDARAMALLGRIRAAQDKLDEAIELLEKAVELDPNSSEYHYRLGEAYADEVDHVNMFRKLSIARRIRSNLQTAIELDPNNLDAREALIVFYVEAPGLAGGSIAKAEEAVAALSQRDKIRGRAMLASVREKEDDLAEAEKQYRLNTEEEPGDPRVWRDLGYFLARREQYAGASEAFERAVAIDPEDIGSLYQVGRIGAVSGRNLDRAAEALRIYLTKKVSRRVPPHAWASFRLGNVYEKQGKTEAARAAYASAVRMDPALKQARAALRKLK
ncbi:MAG: tetratricopeptide repeat protein [Acidobacteriota bacterium]